jgi:outer membrane lipoprotein-sorting protein
MIVGNGCSPSKGVVHEGALPLEEILRRVRERNQHIKTLKGDGSITVESPEESNSGSFDVDLKKPDSLRVEFSGPFGIHVGTLTLSPQQFVFYDWRENTATIGKPDGKTLRSVFRISLRFDEILRAFTGEFLADDAPDSLRHFSVMDDLYVIRYQTGEGEKEFRIDPETFVVSGYRLLDDKGIPKLIATASKFDEEQGVITPRLLRVIVPGERRSVTIVYSNIKLNEPVQCSFALPRRAEVIYR